MKDFLKETALLNFNSPEIQRLIKNRDWQNLGEEKRIESIYNYVRDEIAFGYNASDNISASAVLADSYGQCNTKGTLFMAILRAVGIPCRIHGFYIDKILQKGAMKSWYYALSPKEILHSWIEIYFNGEWLNLEGFILDKKYLGKLQEKFDDCSGSFCGYGVAIDDFKNPPIDWNGGNTYIQKDGIVKDLGIFNNPDEFYAAHQQKLGRFKRFVFKNIIRYLMNRNVNIIRNE